MYLTVVYVAEGILNARARRAYVNISIGGHFHQLVDGPISLENKQTGIAQTEIGSEIVVVDKEVEVVDKRVCRIARNEEELVVDGGHFDKRIGPPGHIKVEVIERVKVNNSVTGSKSTAAHTVAADHIVFAIAARKDSRHCVLNEWSLIGVITVDKVCGDLNAESFLNRHVAEVNRVNDGVARVQFNVEVRQGRVPAENIELVIAKVEIGRESILEITVFVVRILGLGGESGSGNVSRGRIRGGSLLFGLIGTRDQRGEQQHRRQQSSDHSKYVSFHVFSSCKDHMELIFFNKTIIP